jgi:hypothetical protein
MGETRTIWLWEKFAIVQNLNTIEEKLITMGYIKNFKFKIFACKNKKI